MLVIVTELVCPFPSKNFLSLERDETISPLLSSYRLSSSSICSSRISPPSGPAKKSTVISLFELMEALIVGLLWSQLHVIQYPPNHWLDQQLANCIRMVSAFVVSNESLRCVCIEYRYLVNAIIAYVVADPTEITWVVGLHA